MTFAPKEIIVGASVPLENGGSVTFSVAGRVEAERDFDDAVVIFSRKLLKYTNCATDADRLTVRQVVSSITSTPLDKVPDVGKPTSPAPVKEPAKVAPPVAAPTAAEQAAAAVAQCIKPPTAAPEPAPSAPPEGFSLCAECGEAVPANQAKLSQLFQGKTLCKSCMDKSQGAS